MARERAFGPCVSFSERIGSMLYLSRESCAKPTWYMVHALKSSLSTKHTAS